MSIRSAGVRVRAAAILAASAALWFAAAPAHAIDMKIGFVTINDSQHRSAIWFAKEIEKRTNGEIVGKIYPSAQLGGIQRQIEGIQLGTQEAFISPPAFFIGINPAFQAADAPGLFESFDHQGRTLNHPSVREKFLNLAANAGIVGAYVWAAGETAIASRDPIRTLDDMKGMKIRALASKMELRLMQELGMTGVPMDYSELLPAIQRRMVDGASSAIVVMGPSKFYTAVKYVTITASAYIPSGMWVSRVWLDKLEKRHRDLIFQLGREVTPIAQQAAIEITRYWERKWAEEGGEVIRLSKEDQAELYRRTRPLGDEFLGGDERIRDMYVLIKAAAEETRKTN